MYKDVFEMIPAEEAAYKLPVPVSDSYEWGMREHIEKTVAYKNSQYLSGKNDDKPFKNIIRPLLNLQYRAEGFDVKDIELFVDSQKEYYKSFLVRKYHEKWARKYEIDTFIDEMVESFVDFGGALVKNVNSPRPEVVPLQSIAFCDQTDLLSGPLAIKHNYSPDQLLEMGSKGWGETKNGATTTLDDVIFKANEGKEGANNESRIASTPGKYIEVYEVHGVFPASWLKGEDKEETKYTKYVRQVHIVTFYKDDKGAAQGTFLFRGKLEEPPFKLILRDAIFGRALGLGGAEELFEPQVWVNYDVIRVKAMLDAASKVLYKTTDAAFANRNKTNDMDSGEILTLEEGKDISQLNTNPVNITVFENSVKTWEDHARQMASANEVALGEQPNSGTPFKLQELVIQENNSLHDYRKGKLATFVDELYRDWILPYITKEISKGSQFLAELDLDELQAVADSLVVCQANYLIKEKILNGEDIDLAEVDTYKQQVREEFMKGGNKRFLEIFKDEMKDAPIDVYTNIAGKQKNKAAQTDKLVNIFRQIIAAPQVLDDPRLSKIFNEILENSGLSPVDFYQRPKALPPGAPPGSMPVPPDMKALATEQLAQ